MMLALAIGKMANENIEKNGNIFSPFKFLSWASFSNVFGTFK